MRIYCDVTDCTRSVEAENAILTGWLVDTEIGLCPTHHQISAPGVITWQPVDIYDEAKPLSDLEMHAISLTAELANTVSQIVGHGPTREHDMAELVAPIHNIQHALMAQAAARIFPGRYRLLGETLERDQSSDPDHGSRADQDVPADGGREPSAHVD